MTRFRRPEWNAPTTAIEHAQDVFNWYVDNSKKSRLRFQISEVILVVVASSVPIAGPC